MLLNQKCVYYYNCSRTVDECKLCDLITHKKVVPRIQLALQNKFDEVGSSALCWNDDVLGPADTILSPANSCLYFEACMGAICPCHLLGATKVVPQIKASLKEG